MTSPYDRLNVAPDPALAEELLHDLHARMETIAHARHRRPDLDSDAFDGPDEAVALSAIRVTGRERGRRPWVAAAAATTLVIAGSIAVRVARDDVDDDTLTAATADAPATHSPTSPPSIQRLLGEEIRISADVIEYGDELVLPVDQVAVADGVVYVLAGMVDGSGGDDGVRSFGLGAETAVLAAFDDAGVERWRVELAGKPTDVVVVEGDPWVLQSGEQSVSRIDASDGRTIGHVTVDAWQSTRWLYGAFGAVWLGTQSSSEDLPGLVRVRPDLSTTTIELPGNALIFAGSDFSRGPRIAAAAGMLWVPLSDGGVALVDPDTNELSVIPAEVIGHEAEIVAADDDVVYVTGADPRQITSIADGQVRATATLGNSAFIAYLGRLDGAFGALREDGLFQTLGDVDATLGEEFQLYEPGDRTYGIGEIDGEAWIETLGPGNWGLRRLRLLSCAAGSAAPGC